MYCIVRIMAGTDQEFRVIDPVTIVDDVFHRKRVHMMNYDLTKDFKALDAEVATVIADDYDISRFLPSWVALIELLVDKTVETECVVTDSTGEFKVVETIGIGWDCYEFAVASRSPAGAKTRPGMK